jgi:hypothetical protein
MIDKTSGILLSNEYWDCECSSQYIHPRRKQKCYVCGAWRENQPDSHVDEALAFGFPVDMTVRLVSWKSDYEQQQSSRKHK